MLSSEHLTTKRQIESVREMFGEDNWLHSHGGSYVQDILGIKQQPELLSFPEKNSVQFLISNIYKCTILCLSQKVLLCRNQFFIVL